jgi:hypothetical protein
VPSEITGVESESNYVQAKAGAARRGGNEISYDVSVKLRPDTPVGRWFTDVWVKTSNPSMPRVRVPLTVEIESALTLSTSTLSLGEVKVGATAEKKLVVRGSTPFKVTSVKGTDAGIEVKPDSADSKAMHVLTVRLKGDKAGKVKRTPKVITDLKDDGEVEFTAKAQVVP